MLRKTVPDPYSSDWISSVAVGRESGTRNRQFVRRSGTQTPSKLRLCWMMKFVSEVRRLNEACLRPRQRPNLKSPNRTLYFTVKTDVVKTLYNR